MPTAIVVEVYAPQPRPEQLSALLSACTRAAAPVECVTAEARGSEPPLGVAIVRREGDRARIELGLRGVAGAEWTTRDLLFQTGDDELERHRAIGFAIGTLAAGKREPQAATPKHEPARPPRAAASPPPARRSPRADPVTAQGATERGRATWLDLSGGLGLGLIPGPARAGVTLRGSTELFSRGLFGLAETGYAERLGDSSLRVRWLSLSLGVGHPLVPRSRTVGVDVRLQAVAERLSLTALEGERRDAAARWKAALSAAIDAHWDALPPVGVLLTASTHFDPERSVVRIAGTQVSETPALGLSGFVGLRLKLR